MAPLLPLVLLITQLPLLRLRERGLAVHLHGHLILVVTLRLRVLGEAAVAE